MRMPKKSQQRDNNNSDNPLTSRHTEGGKNIQCGRDYDLKFKTRSVLFAFIVKPIAHSVVSIERGFGRHTNSVTIAIYVNCLPIGRNW